MTSRVYYGYQQVLSQPRSALPILPSTQRPDFQLICIRLLSKSACLWGLQRPRTPSWKRLVLTTLLKNRSAKAFQRLNDLDIFHFQGQAWYKGFERLKILVRLFREYTCEPTKHATTVQPQEIPPLCGWGQEKGNKVAVPCCSDTTNSLSFPA